MTRLIVNIVGFQAGWLSCVVGAANGLALLGPLVVVCVLAVHLWLHAARRREALAIGVVACVGTLVDAGLAGAGVLTFEHGSLGVFSLWLGALWVNFAATLSVSLRWLGRWVLVAAVLGAVSGPSTYYAGMRLGAIGFGTDVWRALGILALEWAIALPLALMAFERIHRSGLGESGPEDV